jgi:cold shock CspA family protein
MSFTSGTLVYWNTHSGFGQIELDDGDDRIDIYSTDLLRVGLKTPLVGDHFHFITTVINKGVSVVAGLCLDIG